MERDMIERYRERYGYLPHPLAADTTYGNGELARVSETNREGCRSVLLRITLQ